MRCESKVCFSSFFYTSKLTRPLCNASRDAEDEGAHGYTMVVRCGAWRNVGVRPFGSYGVGGYVKSVADDAT